MSKNIISLLQMIVVGSVGLIGANWANEAEVREHNRIERQYAEDRQAAQIEAISLVSRELGLMEAQCDKTNLLEYGKNPRNDRDRQCYESYIEARSLYYLSKSRIKRKEKVDICEWNRVWSNYLKELKTAGTRKYNPEKVLDAWQKIVNMSRYSFGAV